MEPLGIARRLAELGQKPEACRAYGVALENQTLAPLEQFEAASYIFFAEGDYKIAFTTFVSLYNQGNFQSELMEILTQGFYEPNKKQLQRRYQKNCKLLQKYPYFFREEFPDFEALPVRFYPFDEKGYIPFFKAENRFGEYVNFDDPVVDRYFFRDLEKPVLARDVFSRYQLEYLNDNVRKSEWVGRENHIYLHYTDYARFCAYLQCFNLRTLLEDRKFVFLMEDEIAQYPIDFKARFGIDYSRYPLRPVGIREVQKLIWHTQLSSHNGGDFFNEILYDHPNVISYTSLMYDNLLEQLSALTENINTQDTVLINKNISIERMEELASLRPISLKDTLVAFFLGVKGLNLKLDPASRIVPALMIQPHFHNMIFNLKMNEQETAAMLVSEQYREIQESPMFRRFKYIKTFTPLRRLTTSYAATVRFMEQSIEEEKDKVYPDALMQRLLNRSFMVGPQDTLYRDSILVRFEDGKLNPKATFTRLAEFLDIPYTESMTYCSDKSGLNPESLPGNARGFDPATVYRTYDEYADDAERTLIEALMQDVYKEYGYNFHYYHGEELTEEWLEETLSKCHCLYDKIWSIAPRVYQEMQKKAEENGSAPLEDDSTTAATRYINGIIENRRHIVQILFKGLTMVNENGQPLHFMKMLQPDPDLLEQPLYR